jgi:hypothetical protein
VRIPWAPHKLLSVQLLVLLLLLKGWHALSLLQLLYRMHDSSSKTTVLNTNSSYLAGV